MSVLAREADPARMRRRLVEAFGHDASRRVVVGWRSAATAAQVCGGEGAAGTVVRAGCLTKLFTAELTRAAAAEGLLDLEDGCADVLGDPRSRAARVTIRQLLEHTHGLDACIDRVPIRSSGYIDWRALRAACRAAPRLAQPGRLYCYGDLGAWLAAALLERLTQRRYAALLEERLFPRPARPRRAGRSGTHGALPRILCPSTGGPLAVTCETVLDVLARAAFGRGSSTFREAVRTGAVTPLPGWSMLERGVLEGWKYYGDGWFGHHSAWPGAEALVRANPGRRVALVVASSGPPVLVVAARLLGALLPELRALRIPRPVDASAARGADPPRIVGTYVSAAETITVAAAADGGLCLRASLLPGGPGAKRHAAARLRPTSEGVLLTAPAIPRLPFVQIVEAPGEREPYLWNGQRVWRRVARPAKRPGQRV